MYLTAHLCRDSAIYTLANSLYGQYRNIQVAVHPASELGQIAAEDPCKNKSKLGITMKAICVRTIKKPEKEYQNE